MMRRPLKTPWLCNACSRVRLHALVLVPDPLVGQLTQRRYLQATLMLPMPLLTNAVALQEANREYQEGRLRAGACSACT